MSSKRPQPKRTESQGAFEDACAYYDIDPSIFCPSCKGNHPGIRDCENKQSLTGRDKVRVDMSRYQPEVDDLEPDKVIDNRMRELRRLDKEEDLERRHEVQRQIIADLDTAIVKLKVEQAMRSNIGPEESAQDEGNIGDDEGQKERPKKQSSIEELIQKTERFKKARQLAQKGESAKAASKAIQRARELEEALLDELGGPSTTARQRSYERRRPRDRSPSPLPGARRPRSPDY